MSSPSKIFLLIIVWIFVAVFCIYNELKYHVLEDETTLKDRISNVIKEVSETSFITTFSSDKEEPQVLEKIVIIEEKTIIIDDKVELEKELKEKVLDEKQNDIIEKEKEEEILSTPLEKPLAVNTEIKKNEEIEISAKEIQEKINLIIKNNKIIFKRLSIDVTLKSENTIKIIASLLNEYKNIKIEVAGHTDAKGEEAFNLDISKKRASSVKNKLIEYGLDENRVSAKGYGESKPIVKNDGNGYSVVNRRVEFNIIKE